MGSGNKSLELQKNRDRGISSKDQNKGKRTPQLKLANRLSLVATSLFH